MRDTTKRILARLVRGAVPLALLAVSGVLENSPELVFLLPALNALGKALREKFPGWYWLPI